MTLADRLHPNKAKWIEESGKVSLDKENFSSQNVAEVDESEAKEPQNYSCCLGPIASQRIHIDVLKIGSSDLIVLNFTQLFAK
jgi:hypothetical protein